MTIMTKSLVMLRCGGACVDGGARIMFDIYSMVWAAVGRGSLRGSLSWVTFWAYVGHFIGESYVKIIYFLEGWLLLLGPSEYIYSH